MGIDESINIKAELLHIDITSKKYQMNPVFFIIMECSIKIVGGIRRPIGPLLLKVVY